MSRISSLDKSIFRTEEGERKLSSDDDGVKVTLEDEGAVYAVASLTDKSTFSWNFEKSFCFKCFSNCEAQSWEELFDVVIF